MPSWTSSSLRFFGSTEDIQAAISELQTTATPAWGSYLSLAKEMSELGYTVSEINKSCSEEIKRFTDNALAMARLKPKTPTLPFRPFTSAKNIADRTSGLTIDHKNEVVATSDNVFNLYGLYPELLNSSCLPGLSEFGKKFARCALGVQWPRCLASYNQDRSIEISSAWTFPERGLKLICDRHNIGVCAGVANQQLGTAMAYAYINGAQRTWDIEYSRKNKDMFTKPPRRSGLPVTFNIDEGRRYAEHQARHAIEKAVATHKIKRKSSSLEAREETQTSHLTPSFS